jgi:hypothetical protein
MLEQLIADFLVKMNDNLGVGLTSKLVAARFEILAQSPEIVYLTIEYNPDRTVFVADRLMTAR